MKNRLPFIALGALLAGIPIFLIVYPLILPGAPTWAVVGALLIGLVPVALVSRYFVFRIGIGEERIIFRKAVRKLEVRKSEVMAVEISPPYAQSDIEKPWYMDKNCTMTITLINKKSIVFHLIELTILDQIRDSLQN